MTLRPALLAPALLAGPLLAPATLAGGAPGAVPTAAARAGGSTLEAREASHDFGPVHAGAVLAHTFRLAVEGTDPVVIHRIKPSCGCTVADVWRVGPEGERVRYEEGEAIAPGERLELVARLDTARQRGAQARPIAVYHDGRGGLVEVLLRADVRPLLEAEPEVLDLGKLSARESREGSVLLRARDGEPVLLRHEPDGADRALSVGLTPLEPGADGRSTTWRADVRFGPVPLEAGASPGLRRERVALVTDRALEGGASRAGGGAGAEPALLTHELTVTAHVLAPVSATPRFLSFGSLRPDALAARTVRVNVYDPGTAELPEPEWRVLDGKDDAPFAHADACRVTITPVPEVRGWDVELVLDGLPDDLRSAFHGRILLSFPGTDLPDLPVPFTGFQRAKLRPEARLPRLDGGAGGGD